MNKFIVLLGIDNAGKTTLLNSGLPPKWRVISYDPEFIPPQHQLISDTVKIVRKNLTSPLLSSYYEVLISFMAHEVEAQLHTNNVICNSYFYKFLAKDQIAKQLKYVDIWRSSKSPDLVIFLDTPPETAATRITLSQLNPTEYYGKHPTKKGFIQYQSDLKKILLEEISGLPYIKLDGRLPPPRLAKQLSNILKSTI